MTDESIRLSVRVPSVALMLDKKLLRQALRRAGAEVAAAARSAIKKAAGGGAMYRGPGGSAAAYRGGYTAKPYQASVAGSAPVSVTGTLAKSIKVRPFKSGDGVAVRASSFYALFLQEGAKGGGRHSKGGKPVRGKGGIGRVRVLAPRPFLTTALAGREESIGARVQAAVIDGIEFKRIRA